MRKNAMITTTLAALLAVSAPISVGATSVQTAVPISISITESVVQQVSHIYETKAVVLAITKDGDKVISLLVQEESRGHGEILFKVSDETIFIDNENEIPATPGEIAIGEVIYVYGSSAMTFSLPPQANTFVVLTNLDKKSPARFIESREVSTDEKGNTFVLDAAGNYNIHIEDGTAIIPYKTRQFVNASDIVEHSRILVWSEIMALSHPAMVPANLVMILPGMVVDYEESTIEVFPTHEDATVDNRDVDSIIISTMAGVFSINGLEVHPLNGEQIYTTEHGVLMVPIRSIAEGFGYEVEWNSENRSVNLSRNEQTAVLAIGSKSYSNQTMHFQLDTSPVIVNDRMHVPIEFFIEVLGIDVDINNNHV